MKITKEGVANGLLGGVANLFLGNGQSAKLRMETKNKGGQGKGVKVRCSYLQHTKKPTNYIHIGALKI